MIQTSSCKDRPSHCLHPKSPLPLERSEREQKGRSKLVIDGQKIGSVETERILHELADKFVCLFQPLSSTKTVGRARKSR